MAGLLNKLDNLTHKDVEPGLEAVIARQDPKDPVVVETTLIIEELYNYYKETGITIRNTNDNIVTALERLSKIFTKRFGANFVFDSETSFLSITEVGPYSNAGITDIKSLLSSLESNYDKEFLMENDVYRNYIAADEYMKKNPVIVDLEKAYFRTWPKESKALLHINLAGLIGVCMLGKHPKDVPDAASESYDEVYRAKYVMTPRVLVAGILHEVGHLFSFYTYQHVTKSTRCVFEDTLKDQIRKTSDPKKALYIAYQAAYSKSSYKVKPTDGMAKVLISVVRSEGERFGFTGNKTSATDAEFIADQFCCRFGLGAENAEGMAAVSKFKFTEVRALRSFSVGLTTLWILITYLSNVFGLVSVTMGLGVALGGIATIATASLPFLIGGVLYTIRNKNYQPVYDNDVRRLERMRLEMIRQVRLYGDVLPKDQLDKLIKDIDATKDLIDETYNNMPRRLKIFTNIRDYVGDAKKEDELDRRLEETMENDLHLAALRFKV